MFLDDNGGNPLGSCLTMSLGMHDPQFKRCLRILEDFHCAGIINLLFFSLTCGTTWHAAGLLGKLRSSAAETKLSNYSVELYSTLEEETGVGTGKELIVQ